MQKFDSKEHTVVVSRDGDEVDVSLLSKRSKEGIKAHFETEQAKDVALGMLDVCDEIECERMEDLSDVDNDS